MIKRYYSSYTGKQIDEAVRAIVENQVTLEDLSPELVAEIKRWISGGSYEDIILLGYFYNDKFYEDNSHTTELAQKENKLYIDIDTNKIYYFKSNGFKETTVSLPNASSENAGVSKIYAKQGTQEDGSITQKFFTESFNNLILTVDEKDSECLVLKKLW